MVGFCKKGGCKKKQLSLIIIEIYPLKLVCVTLFCDFLYKYSDESDVKSV